MAAVCSRLRQHQQPRHQPSYSESDGRRTARRIDQLSRRLFPASFLAFNVIYWTLSAAIEDPV